MTGWTEENTQLESFPWLELYETDQKLGVMSSASVSSLPLTGLRARGQGDLSHSRSLHVTRYFSEHVLGFPVPSASVRSPLTSHLSTRPATDSFRCHSPLT